MALKSLLAIGLIAFNCPITTLAGPAQALQPRDGGVLDAGIYGELAPAHVERAAQPATRTKTTTKKTKTKKTKTKKTKTTTATSTTTTTAPTVPSPDPVPHVVAVPRCDSAGLDNGGCSDNCVCQTDVDGTEYCIAQFSFDDPSITCTSDDDCPQGDICQSLDTGVNRCSTGTQPGNQCTSIYIPARLFKAM